MSAILSREAHALTNGKSLEALFVNGERAALVGPILPGCSDLFVSYYGDQWKWWAVVEGVSGQSWLVRSPLGPQDFPLLLEPADRPVLVRSSWDSAPPPKPKIRSRRPKVGA